MQGIAEDLNMDVTGLALPDAHDNVISTADLNGQVVILSGGGQGAINEGKTWAAAIDKAIEGIDNVKHFRLALTGKLPPMVPKSFIKSMAKKDPPTLFDWESTAESMLQVKDPNSVNVFVIDRNGILRFKFVGRFSDDALEKVVGSVIQL